MRLRFLGTGTSYGVPYIGCKCAVCTSTDARDKRLRASIVIEDGEGENLLRILVDTGPDFRQQMLRADIDKIDAIFWTHAHNDHIIGLDDVRPLSDRHGYIKGYCDEKTMERLDKVFDYCFIQDRDHGGFPRVTPKVIEPFETVKIGEVSVTPLPISHGRAGTIFAYEFEKAGKRFVYASDCVGIPPKSMKRMKGAEVFIVDALRHAAHPNHFNIEQALKAIEKINPRQAFFTHITHDLPHQETEDSLPEPVKVAFDGLELEI